MFGKMKTIVSAAAGMLLLAGCSGDVDPSSFGAVRMAVTMQDNSVIGWD